MKKKPRRAPAKPRPKKAQAAATKPAASPTAVDWFSTALDLHRKGDLAAAEGAYRQALRQDADHADSNNNLAILLRAIGRRDEAVACYRRALASRPADAQIYNNLSCLLIDLSRTAEARIAIRIALALAPDYADAWYNLSNVLGLSGDPTGADAAYRRAVHLNPAIAKASLHQPDQRPTAAALLEAAVKAHQNGQLDTAETGYRAALAESPNHPEANNNLAILLRARGQAAEAAQCYGRALAAQPNDAMIRNNLSCLLVDLSRLDEAQSAARAALCLQPDYADAWFNLGNVQRMGNDPAGAQRAYGRAIRLNPALAANLAGTPVPPRSTAEKMQAAIDLQSAGRLDAAETTYRDILCDTPNHLDANNNLAILLRAKRRWWEAQACYRRAIAVSGDNEKAYSLYNNFSCLLTDMAQTGSALQAIRISLALNPGFADAWFNLGNILRDMADATGARIAYQRAIRLRPDMAQAHSNLGNSHRDASEMSEAVACFEAAIRFSPDLPQPYVNLGETLKEQGRISEAITVFQTGLERHPDLTLLHSNLLFALHYSPLMQPEVTYRAHKFWNDCHARPLRPAPRNFANERSPDRRLKIGYVSPDFCAHSCAHFSEPLLRAHDRRQVEIHCYSNTRRRDATTDRFKGLADQWHSLIDHDDAAAAAQIESDNIDILVDLAGHTAGCRPLLFARKPAPIQVTWLGYPDTTGLSTMDYRFTDAIADPPGATERWHSETLLRLPHGFLSFQPAIDSALCEVSPVQNNGFVTFGSFNNIAKVTPDVIGVWSQILTQLPTARLVLKSRAFADGPTHASYVKGFAENGVTPDRIDLLPHIAQVEDHLRAYDGIDIALDPFPYNGTTTTCEALWMGVPVIAVTGATHVARVSASLLTQCGLTELIASDKTGYVEIAVRLAQDLPRLSKLRRTMRERLTASALCDHSGFAAQVETAFRAMWRVWLAGG